MELPKKWLTKYYLTNIKRWKIAEVQQRMVDWKIGEGRSRRRIYSKSRQIGSHKNFTIQPTIA